MSTSIESTHLHGVVVLQPRVHRDERGWFIAAFRADCTASGAAVTPTSIVPRGRNVSRREVPIY